MWRLLTRIVILALFGLGLVWLADRPGTVTITWLDREIELSVFAGLVLLAIGIITLMVLWWLIRRIWKTPAAISAGNKARRTRKAYESLSQGIIAAGAGDAATAQRHVAIARATLKDEPLLALLHAQTAQLAGDKAAVREVFTTMASKPETHLIGLRGLYAQARDAGDWHAAKAHAAAAFARNSKLPWASQAVLQAYIAHKDWPAAASVIAQQGKAGILTPEEGAQKRAALLTAAALAFEDTDKHKALSFAADAHKLAPALVPAAAALARLHVADGSARKAQKVLRETWALSPHRELAAVAARVNADDPEAQFERVRDLAGQDPSSAEGRYALARAALAARRFDVAREALRPMIADAPQAGTCALMAEIEEGSGHHSEAAHWLKRAIHAPRDPMWVSDGVASPHWVAVSPVTSEIVPCDWRVPFELPAAPLLGFAPAAPAPVPAVAEAPTQKATALPRPPDDPGVDGLG